MPDLEVLILKFRNLVSKFLILPVIVAQNLPVYLAASFQM